MGAILATLRLIRRKMVLQLFLERLVVCALLAAVIALALGSYRHFCGQSPWSDGALVVIALIALISAAVWTCCWLPSLSEVALYVDRRGGTNDRFLTALRFTTGNQPPISALHALAIDECGRFAATIDFSSWKLSLPARTKYLAAPLVAAGLLSFYSAPQLDSSVAPDEAQTEATQRAEDMEKLAAQLVATPGTSATAELEAIAAQLKASAARVRQAAAEKGADPNKTALGELSSIEAMLKKMANDAARPSAEELAALADALEQFEAGRQAAAALRQGDLAEGARELAALNRKLQEAAGGEKVREELAQAIRSALNRAARGQRGALAGQMAQGGPSASESASGGSEAIKRLAELLQQLAGAPSGQAGARSTMDAQTMQKVLAALQNLKYSRESSATNKTSPPASLANSPVMMQSFTNLARADQSAPTQGAAPMGSPGSDQNPTSTENAVGPKKSSEASTAAPAQLTGVLGEGESLHDLLPAAGDPSRSNRRYQEIYEAMAPAAEEAGLQENIPLGSRFYIKRYFQNIRPSQ